MSPDQGHVPDDKRRSDLLRKRFGMEPRLVKDFERVLRSDLATLDRSQVFREEGEAVWKLLRTAGVREGLAAVAFTFFGLNRLPRYLARHASRKQQQGNHYLLDKPKNQQQSPFQLPNPKKVEKQAEAEQVFVNVPLQPGRSLISEKLCGNLLAEYQKQWKKDAHAQEILREPHHHALQLITRLAQNCRHRQVMEQELREEQGLPATALVTIPDSGVIPISEDPLLDMMQEHVTEVKGPSSATFSRERVLAWVQDQED